MQAELPAVFQENLIQLLTHCRHQKDLIHGRCLHAFMCRHRVELHPVLGNHLVPLLAECGSLPEAQYVFDHLPLRNEHSWTSIISGYIDHGELAHAFHLYSRLQEDKFAQPNKYTYLALLNACVILKDAHGCKELHTESTKRGLEKELYVASALMHTYIKVGLLVEARSMFDTVPARDAVCWNGLFAGYVECGLAEEVLKCFKQMQLEVVSATDVTFLSMLKFSGTWGAVETGKQMHMEIIKRGWEQEFYLSNTLVDMYTKCGSLAEAHEVFVMLPVRNSAIWNTMIKGYIEHGLGDKALICLQQMQLEGVYPDSFTYSCGLKACCLMRALKTGQHIHAEVTKLGLETEVFMGGSLVDMYNKCTSLVESCNVFDQIPVRDVVLWNTLIAGYSEHSLDDEVLNCFQQMHVEGLSFDAVTCIYSLRACGRLEDLEVGQKIHMVLVKRGLERELYVGHAIVDMYCKCGMLVEARLVLECLPFQETVLWNALLGGYIECGNNVEVLNCFRQMWLDGVSMDAVTFAFSLRVCNTLGNLETGQCIHAETVRRGLEGELIVGSAVLSMYGKCGLLGEAGQVFDRLATQDTSLWNGLMAIYAEHGLDEAILNCFNDMQQAGVPADAATFVCNIKVCSTRKFFETGKEIYSEVTKRGLEKEAHVARALIDMYTNFGLLDEAQQLFDQIPDHDKVLCNTLVAGYAEHDHDVEVLSCLQQESVSADVITLVHGLKTCGIVGILEIGQDLHAKIVGKGLERDLYIGSALVDLYCKCGFLEEAQRVLHMLPSRNRLLWTVLMAGYTEQGMIEKVLNCLTLMQLEGLSADAVTLITCLKACGSARALETGQSLHTEIRKLGLERDCFVGNMLVDMYGKCGSFEEAQEVFCQLPVRDVTSWNALIAGYAEQKLGEQAGDLFNQMQLEGVCPDSVTFVCSLKVCATIRALETCQELHAEIIKRGYERELYVGNALVDVYVECGFLSEAHHAFDMLPLCDEVSWNTLMAGYVELGHVEDVLNGFHQLQLKSVSAGIFTFVCALKACSASRAWETGQDIHAELIMKGLESEHRVCCTLLDMYGNCGLFVEAHQMFDRLPVRTTDSWNALIAAYIEHEHNEKALNCFKQMQLEGMSFNAVTFVHCLKACIMLGALETGQEIHAEIRRSGLEGDPCVSNLLIDMYAKCGLVAKGQEVFEKLLVRDVVTWTAMIKAYGENHECDMAVKCFEEMQEQGVKPDSVTFSCLLTACSHASLTNKGQQYFEEMKEHGIEPTLEHYVCMADLFARSGQIYEAEIFIAAVQGPLSSEVAKALLSACKIYGKLEMAHRCFQQLIKTNQEDASAYLLMADVYVSAGRLDEANSVEQMRKSVGKVKKPGNALIEVRKKIHEFVVGIKQDKKILDILESIHIQMDDWGYVPNVEWASRQAYIERAKDISSDL